MDEPETALKYFNQSCDIRQEAGLMDAYTTSLLYKAECFLNLNELNLACDALIEAKPLVKRFNVPTKKLHMFELKGKMQELTGNYADSLKAFHHYDELKSEIREGLARNIFKLKNRQIADQKEKIETKHSELRDTLGELARIKASRKALLFSILTVIALVVSTELFLDPIIEDYSANEYLSIGSKVLIAFLLKPIDSLYERLLFKRAYRGS